MAVGNDEKYMRRALSLAEKGRGKTSPNPMVGAVLVKSGRIVGEGYHEMAGTAHAEINALENAGNKAGNATLYVTLEPCCHHGRTGPCTEAIIRAGIKRVVFAQKDPNPSVNGRGARYLRRAGVEVTSGVLKKDAAGLNEVYHKYITTSKPFVILKTAQTLDGRIATVTGDARWITGEKARRYGHRLRAECDAVMVGSGTVQTDNPRLTVRAVKGANPYRIMVSEHPTLKKSWHLLKDNADARTILATGKMAAADISFKNLIIWEIAKNRQGLSLEDLLKKAGRFGITSILVEGGAGLATSFLKGGLVDKHYLFVAPKIVGKGKGSYGDLNIRKINDSLVYRDYEYDLSLAPDLLFIGYPAARKAGR